MLPRRIVGMAVTASFVAGCGTADVQVTPLSGHGAHVQSSHGWGYNVVSSDVRVRDAPAAPTFTRLAVRLRLENTGGRRFDVSTTVDLPGMLRIRLPREALAGAKCPAPPAGVDNPSDRCVLTLSGLPSENQTLAPHSGLTRDYIVDDDLDARLRLVTVDQIEVYAGGVRIR